MDISKTFQQIKAYANSRSLPLLPICAKNISILKEPSSFYEFLLNKNREARRRVALSSLYIGSGAKERALLQALCDNLNRNPEMIVNISLDFNRAKRIDNHGSSSVSVLQDILVYDTVTLNLIKTSRSTSLIQRILSRFDKWNELTSTYHSKLLVYDNDVMFTGANLSSIYFERRKDRYVFIRNSRLLSDYVYTFLDKLNFSAPSLAETIEAHNNKYLGKLDECTSNQNVDSYILPLCQHGPSGIHHCDDFLRFLEDILPQGAQLHMSSGYFNPRLKLKLKSVLVPSEQANGFYNGAGLVGFVPRIYSALLKKYKDLNPSCSINLFKKPGWSFHAKGLWIDGIDDITIHMIGSSNFNWRSSTRDFEIQFVIITKDEDLKRALSEERQKLWADSYPVSQDDFSGLNPIYSSVANILKSLL